MSIFALVTLLLFPSLLSAQPLHPSNQEALCALSQSLQGLPSHWTCANAANGCSWSNDLSPSDYYVQCRGNRILGFYFSFASGTLPPQIGLLTSLEYLDVGINQISGTLPTQLGQLTSVNDLVLGPNQFSGPIPTEFGRLTRLTFLSFVSNDLDGTFPTELINARNLAYLRLGTNALSGTIPDIFNSFPSLTYLDLAQNAFSGTIPPSVMAIPGIVELDLANNQLGGTIADVWPRFLMNLKLNGNQFSGTLPSLRVNPNLRQLKLGGNLNLWGTIPSDYGIYTRNLTQFDISSTQIKGGCWPTGLFPLGTCEASGSQFSCSCPAPRFCQACSCYNYTSAEYCATYARCPKGTVCQEVPPNWYQCIQAPSTPVMPLESCVLNDECNLYGCGSPVQVEQFGIHCNESTVNHRLCVCGHGFNGTTDLIGNEAFIGCTAIGECSGDNDKCKLDGKVCNQTTFMCQSCPNGYVPGPDAIQCIPVGPCSPDPEICVGSSTICDQTTFTCFECGTGLIPNANKTACDAIGPCSGNPLICLELCDQDNFTCVPCPSGYRVSASKTLCQAIGPCSGGVELCTGSDQVCNPIAFTCDTCLAGSLPDALKTNCQDIDECTLYGCPGVSSDVVDCIQEAPNERSCICAANYTGSIRHIRANDPFTGQCIPSLTGPEPLNIGVYIGAAIGGLIVIVLILIILFFYFAPKQIDLSRLPAEVRWSYSKYQKNPRSWNYVSTVGTQDSGYYSKELLAEDFNRVKSHFVYLLGGGSIIVKTITAVYNPTLISNFINTIAIRELRLGQQVFNSKSWMEESPGKAAVYNHYLARVDQMFWNQGYPVPILLAAHGTDADVASKICETGFASLQTLDAGYYGQGIYFTTYAHYTLTYFAQRKHPSIVLSWVVPGNVFPVTEDRKSPQSLCGLALKSGYNSHYVVTNRNGDIPDPEDTVHFDEIVVGQESQISPAFILSIEKNTHLKTLVRDWKRTHEEEELRRTVSRTNLTLNEIHVQLDDRSIETHIPESTIDASPRRSTQLPPSATTSNVFDWMVNGPHLKHDTIETI